MKRSEATLRTVAPALSLDRPAWRVPQPLLLSLMIHLAALVPLGLEHNEAHRVDFYAVTLTHTAAPRISSATTVKPHTPPRKPQLRTVSDPSAPTLARAHEPAAPADAAPPAPAGATPVVSDTTATSAAASTSAHNAISEYVTLIVKKLDAAKRYPRESLLREEQGLVLLALVISADGQIRDAQIDQPSPFEALNDASLAAARGLTGLPEVPGIHHGEIRVRVPIRYQLSRR